MLYRPSTLPAADRDAFEAHAESCRERMLDHVHALVETLPPVAARPVYELAFSPNDALPKRERRPKLDTVILVEAVADACGVAGADRAALFRLTILTQEYFDIVDDIVDGDVAEGRTEEALLVSQLLVPLVVETVDRLGSDAAQYWSRQARSVLCVPFEESTTDPGPEAYLSHLDRQASLYAVCTGLGAVVAGSDDDMVDRYERLGATVYKHRKVVLDYEQAADGAEETWNAEELFDDATLIETLEQWERTVTDLVTAMPGRPARHIRALVALDVHQWRETVTTAMRDGKIDR